MLIATFLDAAEHAHAALTAWDQAAGDGDFGDNLRDGLREAVRRMPADADIGTELATAAEWFLDHVGGTSGPLFGLLFDSMSRQVRAGGDTDAHVIDGLADGAAAIQRVGEARVGDRTMIDALVPAVEYLRQHGSPVDWDGAAGVAMQSARATATIRARMGRASYVGDRAVGTPDPGAAGVALLIRSLAVERSPHRATDMPDLDG